MKNNNNRKKDAPGAPLQDKIAKATAAYNFSRSILDELLRGYRNLQERNFNSASKQFIQACDMFFGGEMYRLDQLFFIENCRTMDGIFKRVHTDNMNYRSYMDTIDDFMEAVDGYVAKVEEQLPD